MDEDASASVGVRIVTVAPEINGVLDAAHDLDQRGIVFSIGHRFVKSLSVRGLFTC